MSRLLSHLQPDLMLLLSGLRTDSSLPRLPGRDISSTGKFKQIMTLGLRYFSLGSEKVQSKYAFNKHFD